MISVIRHAEPEMTTVRRASRGNCTEEELGKDRQARQDTGGSDMSHCDRLAVAVTWCAWIRGALEPGCLEPGLADDDDVIKQLSTRLRAT